MNKLAVAAACVALLMLFSCGGKGASWHALNSGPGSAVGATLPANGQSAGQILTAEPLDLNLPGTVPPEPKDVAAAIARATSNAPVVKHASAALATIGAGNITVTSPPVSGAAHNYQHSDGNVWAEGQDTTTFNQYHVYGTVNSLNLGGNLTSYATIGLCTWFDYDYALNQATPPNSAYLFNQNVYLLIRRVAADPPNTYRIRLGDMNGKTGGFEVLATTPFTYDMQLNPTNPIVSVPGAPPYTDHQCGTATFSVNSVPVPGVLSYGADNWGWRTAAGPERYNAGAGGSMLLGQVYASGNSLTSAMNFNATFWSGAIANPLNDPSEWWCLGQSRDNARSSDFAGPLDNSVKWHATYPFADSPPVLSRNGSVYVMTETPGELHSLDVNTGATNWVLPGLATVAGFMGGPCVGQNDTIYLTNAFASPSQLTAVTDNGASASVKWTLALPGFNTEASPVTGVDGTIYCAASDQFHAVHDNGPSGTLTWSLPVGTVATPAIGADGTIYIEGNDGNLYAISDLGAVGAIKWTFPLGVTASRAGPAIADDGTLYVATGTGMTALVDGGASPTVRWTRAMSAPLHGFAVSAGKTVYSASQDSQLYAIQDNGATSTQQWTFYCGCYYSIPVVDTQGMVYIMDTGFAPGTVYGLLDNGASVTTVWTLATGGSVGWGECPIITKGGSLLVPTFVPNGDLYSIGLGTQPVNVDCTALANASFSLYNPGGSPLTGTLDTDVVYDATPLGFVPGSTFYVALAVDNLASPNDLLVYPPRPDGTVGGVVTVNAGSLTIPPSLTPYFDNPVGTRTLKLKTDAYNRIGNDETALTDALYSFYDTTANLTFSPGLTTRSSLGKSAVLAANTNYRIDLTPAAYPVAGSNGSFNGAPEAVYPKSFAGGFFSVGFGTLSEGGAVAGPDNDNTDFYDQAGLVNTLQPDAYCRFETNAGPLLASDYGFYDMNTGNWIIVPSFPFGREPQARPFDTFAFARSTAFQASDGANFSGTVTVTPGKQLNFVGYPGTVPLALGVATLTLRPLPARVWDDPAQPDPGQPGADVTGTGPWTVPLNFLLQFGQGPWTVELDADYGGAWDDGAPGRVYTVTGSPFTTLGLKTALQVVPNTLPLGFYIFAIRVTDSAGSQYTYVWPTPVDLTNGGLHPRGGWYMTGGNRTGNGQAINNGPLTPGVRTPVWSTPSLGGWYEYHVSPVLDGLDNSFFSSGNGFPTNRLHSFDVAGNAAPGWPIAMPGGTSAGLDSACVGPTGDVYFGLGEFGAPPSHQGVKAYKADGSPLWTWLETTTPNMVTVSDVAAENGYVYVVLGIPGSGVYNLYTLLAATGTQVNVANVGSPNFYLRSGFAISDTGMVYYHGADQLYALTSNGVLQYSTPLPVDLAPGRPVIAPDLTVYVTDGNGTLHSYIDSGAGFLPNFTFSGGAVGGSHFQSPAIRNLGAGQYWIYVDEENYLNANDVVLQKFDQLGNLLATSPVAGAGKSMYPALGADGTVYVNTDSVGVSALDGGSLATIWSCTLPTNPIDSSPAIGADGGLYIVAYDGVEYKIHD